MATRVGSGGPPPTNTPQGAIYQQILAQTGDRAQAEQAAAYFSAGIDAVFHQTMVNTGGDEAAARAAQRQYAPQVAELAGLVPTIQAGGDAAGPALTRAMGVLDQVGFADTESLYPWLNQHVGDDAALEAAGLDPSAVRAPPDTPWAHADVDALVSLVRDALVRYEGPNGERLSDAQIGDYLDQARAAARRYGAGAARAPDAPASDAPVQSVASLAIPLRV